ncbi:hypothetical protein SAMN02787142_0568 [Burkholderia sp. WP9]|uniref:hypothetical protein n=1 Tax=Burkholderia sp. WP9 TaxID=1500263 RepID=UPI00089D3F11|nr:hypothetical protein [Burkholderia sp. WP9]SEB92259.1 hypothetical protein SAMN02787142_0568 [Burkholderia sp. WP9]
MDYEEQLRDARDTALTPSTRVHAAYDAIFICCQQPGVAARLSADDAALVNTLREWVLNTAPLEPLPISPSEAVALAERVHRTLS